MSEIVEQQAKQIIAEQVGFFLEGEDPEEHFDADWCVEKLRRAGVLASELPEPMSGLVEKVWIVGGVGHYWGQGEDTRGVSVDVTEGKIFIRDQGDPLLIIDMGSAERMAGAILAAKKHHDELEAAQTRLDLEGEG